MSKPKYIWWNGQVCDFHEAQIHVTAETAVRGTNIFEGLRAYWRSGQRAHAVVALEAHMARLRNSARLMYLNVDGLMPAITSGVADLIQALEHSGDLYIRTAVYLIDGRYTADSDAMSLGSYVVAYPVDRHEATPVTCALSNWRHVPDAAFPVGAKVGAAYSIFRMARIDAVSRGAQEPILLNEHGMVAETASASVFAVRRGQILTPPLSDGLLDSITRRIIMELAAARLGTPVVEQSLSKSDLLSADEVFLAGTLEETKPVCAIDGISFPAPGPVTARLAGLYTELCQEAADEQARRWLHFVPAQWM